MRDALLAADRDDRLALGVELDAQRLWYQWQIAMDIPEAAETVLPLRNATVADRTSLAIDAGPRSISGRNAAAVDCSGDYTGVPVKDAQGKDGADLVTANELVVPVGKPVRVHLRTVDVIHSFWIPKLSGKVDMIPNRANFLWFQADNPGYYYGQCAEYCGDSHAIMRFRVIALPQAEYDVWLANQRQPARTVGNASANAVWPKVVLIMISRFANRIALA